MPHPSAPAGHSSLPLPKHPREQTSAAGGVVVRFSVYVVMRTCVILSTHRIREGFDCLANVVCRLVAILGGVLASPYSHRPHKLIFGGHGFLSGRGKSRISGSARNTAKSLRILSAPSRKAASI